MARCPYTLLLDEYVSISTCCKVDECSDRAGSNEMEDELCVRVSTQHAKQHASHKHHDVADGHVRAEASILDRRSRTSKSKRQEAMYSA